MKNLSIQISEIIKNESNLINKKINGLNLLEILKYKIIDNLRVNNSNIETVNKDEKLSESIFENESRRIDIKLTSNQSKVINLNSDIIKNTLIISLKETINIMLKEYESKKKINIKCFPNMGIVIPKGTNCTLNFNENSIILEITSEEKILNIEN